MAETYKFAEFELDEAKRALLKSGIAVSLNPKAFDLLVVLVENRGEIITKDDLINIVWEGQFVEENNITVQISTLRKILGDKAKSAKFLQTIPGSGYKFIADVQKIDDEIIFEKRYTSKLILEEETGDETPKRSLKKIEQINTQKTSTRSYLSYTAFGLIALLTGLLIYQFWGSQSDSKRYRVIKTDKLTTSGKLTNLALTPNGEYAVYSQHEGIGESLWLKHLETGGQQQLIAPQSAKFVGLTVSPDGNFIYFSRFGNEAATYLERISILGGIPEIFKEIDTAVSVTFSPDGKQIAFTESHTAAGETSLNLSAIDGSNKKVLISAKNDKRILATYEANPVAWSPEGDSIAVAIEEKLADGSSEMAILLVDPKDGSERSIAEKRWKHAMELTWIDSDNLAFFGYDEGDKSGNIWVVSRKTGESSHLTNDSNSYQKLSANNGKLIAVKGNKVSRIKLAEFEDDLNKFGIKEVFNESGHIGNVAWADNDSILYTSNANGRGEIWKIETDGTSSRQLTINSDVSGGISVSEKDGSIVFPADKEGFSTLWLVDKDGKNSRQLTFQNEDARVSFMPDGESVVFQRGTTFGKQTLWKMDIKSKESIQITETHTSHPQVSKNGKQTAYYFMDNETDKSWRIGIVDNESGEIISKLSFPVIVNHRRMTWHPTDEFLTQVFYEGEDAKLLLLPIKGDEHKIISNFGKGEIISLDWSKDGKNLLFSQVIEIRDVVSFDLKKE